LPPFPFFVLIALHFSHDLLTSKATMVEATINEERAEGSHSLLTELPTDALNNVYGYILGKEFEKDENADVSKQLAKTVPYIQPRARTGKTVGGKHLQFGVDFSDLTLFEPGNKIEVPLTLPTFHLTQPCFRDLKKHVVKSTGWDLKRIACTEQEKKQHKVTRKSKAYFVNAIYKVPGTAKPKKQQTKKKSKASAVAASAPAFASAASGSKMNASPLTKKRAAIEATAALQAALDSAQEGDGVVDPECLRKALAVGFSKAYIQARVEEQSLKPAAKKVKN